MLAWRTFVRSSNSCTKYEGTPRCPPLGWGNRLVRSPARCSDVRIGGWRLTATPAILPFILNQQGSLTYTIMVMIMNAIPFLHSAYSAVFLRSNCLLLKRGTYLEQKVKNKILLQLKDHHYWTITCLQLCWKDRKYVFKRIQHNSRPWLCSGSEAYFTKR